MHVSIRVVMLLPISYQIFTWASCKLIMIVDFLMIRKTCRDQGPNPEIKDKVFLKERKDEVTKEMNATQKLQLD